MKLFPDSTVLNSWSVNSIQKFTYWSTNDFYFMFLQNYDFKFMEIGFGSSINKGSRKANEYTRK